MENKKTAVFGIYTTVAAADLATDSLVKAGFSAADVSALLPENLGSKPIATEKNSKAPEGAATGAGSGAVLGGTLGLLVGIGALAIPGVGPLIAAGPIMAALAGSVAGIVLIKPLNSRPRVVLRAAGEIDFLGHNGGTGNRF
jgi:hypothetical protein